MVVGRGGKGGGGTKRNKITDSRAGMKSVTENTPTLLHNYVPAELISSLIGKVVCVFLMMRTSNITSRVTILVV